METFQLPAQFASDLGWPPGHWPSTFQHSGLGDALFIVYHVEKDKDNDVRAVLYRAQGGRTVLVYND